jgi:hypothetical protein
VLHIGPLIATLPARRDETGVDFGQNRGAELIFGKARGFPMSASRALVAIGKDSMKAVLIVLSAGLTSAAFAADTLPKEMLGAWASDPKACGEQASELAITIEPRSVLFYEHGYSVRRITRLKDGSLKAVGQSFDDQGRTPDTITLKLISADTLQAKGEIYHRCKPGNSSRGARG